MKIVKYILVFLFISSGFSYVRAMEDEVQNEPLYNENGVSPDGRMKIDFASNPAEASRDIRNTPEYAEWEPKWTTMDKVTRKSINPNERISDMRSELESPFFIAFPNERACYPVGEKVNKLPERLIIRYNLYEGISPEELLNALAYTYNRFCEGYADLQVLEGVLAKMKFNQESRESIGSTLEVEPLKSKLENQDNEKREYYETIELLCNGLSREALKFKYCSTNSFQVEMISLKYKNLNAQAKKKYKKAIIDLYNELMGSSQNVMSGIIDISKFQAQYNQIIKGQTWKNMLKSITLGTISGLTCGYACNTALRYYLQNYKQSFIGPLLGICTVMGGLGGYYLYKMIYK